MYIHIYIYIYTYTCIYKYIYILPISPGTLKYKNHTITDYKKHGKTNINNTNLNKAAVRIAMDLRAA